MICFLGIYLSVIIIINVDGLEGFCASLKSLLSPPAIVSLIELLAVSGRAMIDYLIF